MTIGDLLDRVDDIDDKLKNPKYRIAVSNELLNIKYKKTIQDYKIISAILKNEDDIYCGVSDITIWRLLKIKRFNPEMYERIRRGDIKIKKAYNELFKTNEKPHVALSVDFDKELNFNELLAQVSALNNTIQNWRENVKCEPSIKTLKEIDNNLFEMRKVLGKIMAYYDL